MLTTLDVVQLEMSTLKFVANENVSLNDVTLETSHDDISLLKLDADAPAPRKVKYMSATLDVFH